MPNGIDLIVADHELVNAMFTAFDETGDATIVGQVVDALEAHDSAEQAALYPLLARLVDDAAMLARAEAAHSAVKAQIEHLTGLEGRPLVDAFGALRALVQEHVADEQDVMLPALAAVADAAQLDILGSRLLEAKQRVG